MKKLHVLWLPLVVAAVVGMDCAGGSHECTPPEGLKMGEEYPYCLDGERGYCDQGGHQGTQVWIATPCLEGSTCSFDGIRAVCLRPDGTEAPEPEDVCPTEGLSECTESGLRSCELAASGDLLWTEWRPCTGECSNGGCYETCEEDELGENRCMDTQTLATCTRVDAQLLWLPEPCASGERCMNGFTYCAVTCAGDPTCEANCDVLRSVCAPE